MVSEELLVEDGHLNKVLGHGATGNIVLLRLGDASQEGQRTGAAEPEPKGVQNGPLHFQDLLNGVAVRERGEGSVTQTNKITNKK